MSHVTAAFLVFGGLLFCAMIMLLIERRGVAKRKAARGGREIDVSNLIAFGSAAAEGKKTHN